MSSDQTWKGSCFCGEVEFTVSGEPIATGYCHCNSCRHWLGAPVNAFTLWDPAAINITKGADNIDTYNKTEQSYRKWCKSCGGHFISEHPGMGFTDVCASAIPDFELNPSVHVNYQETVLRIKDGLPKLKDFPAEMGGSGELLPE